MLDGALQHDMRIDANQLAVLIGIAVAGARGARLDVAHHRARIAADLVAGRGGHFHRHQQACPLELLRRQRRRVRSYTNDPAREVETCQAASEAKRPAAA